MDGLNVNIEYKICLGYITDGFYDIEQYRYIDLDPSYKVKLWGKVNEILLLMQFAFQLKEEFQLFAISI